MKFSIGIMLLLMAPAVLWAEEESPQFTAEELAFFKEKVEPILRQKCYRCHSTEKQQKGDLSLNRRKEILVGGYVGPAAVPGKPEKSYLLKTVVATTYSNVPQMPPRGGRLGEREVEVLRKWIEIGLPHRE